METTLTKVLLLLVLISSCKKKETATPRHDPQSYDEAMDSLHINYEQKYILDRTGFYDTLIFHKDGSITEIGSSNNLGQSFSFTPKHLNTYYFYPVNGHLGHVGIKMLPIHDTVTKFILHNTLTIDTTEISIQQLHSSGPNYWFLSDNFFNYISRDRDP